MKMAYLNRELLSTILVLLIRLTAAQERLLMPHDTGHIPAAVPLGWSGKNSNLPLQQRGSAIPLIPNGHKKFQFYLNGPDGQLIPTWMSLQQVQNILLSVDPREDLDSLIRKNLDVVAETTLSPINQTRPKDTVQQVIASVQQVISNEVAHTQTQHDTPSTNAHPVEQSLSIPEVILQNLMVLQQHTTPWHQLPTVRPGTVPEDTSATTVDGSQNVETTVQEVASATESVYEDAMDYLTTTEATMTSFPMETIPAALRPLLDRWNSRFPGWAASNQEGEAHFSVDKTSEIETTDDYHILPPSVSETVLPNDIHHDTSDTSISISSSSTQPLKTVTEIPNERENENEIATTIPPVPSTNIPETSSEAITRSPVAANNDEDQYQATDKVIDEFHHTTLGHIHQPTEPTRPDAGNRPSMIKENSAMTTKSEAEISLLSDTEQEESVVKTTPCEDEEETTTVSNLHSAIVNMATNLIEEMSQTTQKNEELSEGTTVNAVSSQPTTTTVHETTSHPPERADYLTTLSDRDNITPLEIKDPLLPQTIYDIQPVPDPTTTTPRTTAKPSNPYDAPTTFLTVIDPIDETTNAINTEPESSSLHPQNLYNLLQSQSFVLDDNGVPKPHYEFPVKMEDEQTKSPQKVTPESNNEDDTDTTIQGMMAEMLVTPEVTTRRYHVERTDSMSNNKAKTTQTLYTESPLTPMHTETKTESTIAETMAGFSVYNTEHEVHTEKPTIFVTVTPEITNEDQTTLLFSRGPSTPPSTTPQDSTTSPDPSSTPPADSNTTSGNTTMNYAPDLSAIYYYFDEHFENDPSRIDLEALQSEGNFTEGEYFYDYIDQPVYLDDVPKEYYDYSINPVNQATFNVSDDLDFPGPNATSPYHEHHHDGDHHGHHGDHHGHHTDHHGGHHGDHHGHHGHHKNPSSTGDAAQLLEAPPGNPGLEATVETLDPDIRRFVDVINDITFQVYKKAARQYRRKNFVMSPLSLISTLNILLLGARGSTSAALSDLLLIDQFYTFNPHLILKNVTDSVLQMSGIHDVAFFKQFLVEKPSNPYPLDFFSRTINYFYGANISQLEPTAFDSMIRETMNDLVSKATRGSVLDFLTDEPLNLTPPLSIVSTNFFHGRWSSAVTEADLFDMNFIRFPTAERRLIQTVGLKKRMTVNAGYSKEVGVTTAEIPFYSNSGELSLVLVMPGEQKNFVANGLAQVESVMSSEKWKQILRSMLPNTVMFKMPVFRHRSFHNFSGILSELGLEDIFKESVADFSGINTVKNLHLSDVVQLTEFQSCQVEEARPAARSIPSSKRKKRSSQNIFFGETVSENNNISPSGYKPPTFIYGLPMTEYLKRDDIGSTGRYHPSQRRGTLQNSAHESYAAPFGGLNEAFYPVAESAPAEVTAEINQHNKGAKEEYDYYDTGFAEHETPAGEVINNGETLPTLTGFNDFEYNDQDIRINRMGAPYDDYLMESVDETREASQGAYYRQSKEGVLAFDRAFMYAVRHNPTGLLLFVGRYLDPKGN